MWYNISSNASLIINCSIHSDNDNTFGTNSWEDGNGPIQPSHQANEYVVQVMFSNT